MNIPLVDLKAEYETISSDINAAIQDVLKSQMFILGSKVKELEEKIAAYCYVKHGIGVSSGTDALLLALMAIDVGTGDEVITTPFTFFATAGSISRLGAKPVFVDIEIGTYNIDPERIEEKITDKTRAIMPVHLYGQCANMDPILKVAKDHGLYVIEDAAQAIGSRYKGRNAGSIGNIGCLSFFPTKNLGGYGDGGMVLTDDDALAEKIRILRVHGSKPKYYHSVIGINGRLDAIQASILLAKLKYLDKWNEARRENAKNYNTLLSGIDIAVPYVEEFNYHIYHQYVIRLQKREELRESLSKAGIGTEIYYPVPLHLQKCFEDLGYKPGDMPSAEKASHETLALPVYPELTRQQQEYIAKSIKETV